MTVVAQRLVDLEGAIERGLSTFVEVGQALLAIRDERLYRETHSTFEAYCRERWGWSRRHANRTIEAAAVAELLGPLGPTPTSERQARELVPLLDDPESMREAWEAAQANGKPTAAGVRTAVARRRDRSPADVVSFHEDAEGICPTCHGSGRIPLETEATR